MCIFKIFKKEIKNGRLLSPTSVTVVIIRKEFGKCRAELRVMQGPISGLVDGVF